MSEPEAVVTLNEAFQGFKDHLNGHRTSTELTFLEVLRQTHPEFHVTCASPLRFDPLGYATAGNAVAKLDSDESTMDSTRVYRGKPRTAQVQLDIGAAMMGLDPFGTTTASREAAAAGELHNHTRFGRWRYQWEGCEYLLYEIEYSDSLRSIPTTLYFVLSPRTEYSTKEGEDSPIDRLMLAVGAWTAQLHKEIYVYDDGRWGKSRELWMSVNGATWNDVILNPTMKDKLINDVSGFFDSQQLYKKLAVPWKRGIILHGVPGNGKTISIKALINTLEHRPEPIPSLYVKSFDDRCKGEKHSIRTIFSHARTMAPCLLIFEDLDSIVTNENRSYFLNEVDGLESNDGILMIGSTNHLSKLDPAISKRPSRFDRKYHFNLPGEAERAAYCQFWRQKLIDSDTVDFREELCGLIAQLTEGFSFAYLKELFIIVLLTIARGGTGEEVEKEEGSAVSESSPSEDGHVVVEHEDANVEAVDNAQNPESSEEAGKDASELVPAPKIKRVVPDVAIPESLQDNILLRVVMHQVKILLDEMDNTEESKWPSEKTRGGGIPGRKMPVMMPPPRMGF